MPSEGSLRARVPDHPPRRRMVGKRTVAAVAVEGQLPGRHWVRGIDPRRSDLERVGGTGARVSRTDETGGDPGDSCNRMGLHSGRDR